MKYLEILFWKVAIKILKKRYDITTTYHNCFDKNIYCMDCSARDTNEFIKSHIELIKS